MAIAPPSDLVLDVANAASPDDIKEATNRLRALASGSNGHDFRLAYAKAAGTGSSGDSRFNSDYNSIAPEHKSASQKFEAMILTQFVETMMPQNAEMVFGEGTAGEIWKSMLSEQVANQLAASGGVGIADLISGTLSMGDRS